MKKILVIYKVSSYKQYLAKLKKLDSSSLQNKELIRRFKHTHMEHYHTLEYARELFKKLDVQPTIVKREQIKDFMGYDLVITIGGDGTFLYAAKGLRKQKILGVNSDPKWSVGRFCFANRDNLEGVINNYLKKKNKTKTVNRLTFALNGKETDVQVVNDVLICHKNPAAMSRYYITLNKRTEEQRSSGLWVATAAGSTGAIHSAGGTVLPIASKQYQYMTRELYPAFGIKHKLKGGLISPRYTISIASLMENGVIYVDGSHQKTSFRFGDKIQIKPSAVPLRIIVG
ncbi:MAG: NAD(+)/NADH kinase [Candidatus Omnitrophica bacterium]|nr:NAD(+)/NADH kinase [Candidatus Omnitrophota bacterium]